MSKGPHHERSSLRTLFDSTLHAFEDAADDLKDGLLQLEVERKALAWLAHAVASLISWSIDIRIETDSLTAIEGSEIEEQLISILTRMGSEMHAYLRLLSAHDDEVRVTRHPEIKDSVSEAIEALQDLVQPVRMAQADKFRVGPYLGLKKRIDELYMEHTRPEDRVSDDASNSGASILILDNSSESSSDSEDDTNDAADDRPSVGAAAYSTSEDAPLDTQHMPHSPGIPVRVNEPVATASTAGNESVELIQADWKALASAMRASIEQNLVKAFDGTQFLPSSALSSIVTDRAVSQLLSTYTAHQSFSSGPDKGEGMANIIGDVLNIGRKLLAICVYIGMDLSILGTLIRHGVTDSALPISDGAIFGSGADETTQRSPFSSEQYKFLPVTIAEREPHQTLSHRMVLPFLSEVPLGEGSFGKVYKVEIHKDYLPDHGPKHIFAMKSFRGTPDRRRLFTQEGDVLRQLRQSASKHEHVMTHIASWTQSERTYILFPMAESSLQDFLINQEPPDLIADFCKSLYNQIIGLAQALEFLHKNLSFAKPRSRRIGSSSQSSIAFHLDLKPANILISGNKSLSPGIWKISDFGMSKVKNAYRSPEVEMAPFGYLATPVIQRGEWADVWSFGCVLAEIIAFVLEPRSSQHGEPITSEQDEPMTPQHGKPRTLLAERKKQLGDGSDGFWCVSSTNEVMLSANCTDALQQLEILTAGRRGLCDTLALSRKLLSISPQDRLSARGCAQVLGDIEKQALEDFAANEDCYLTRTVPQTDVHSVSEWLRMGLYDDAPSGSVTDETTDSSADESWGSDVGEPSEPRTSASSVYSEEDDEESVMTSRNWTKEWMQPWLLKGLEPRVFPVTPPKYLRSKAGPNFGPRQHPRVEELPEEEDGE